MTSRGDDHDDHDDDDDDDDAEAEDEEEPVVLPLDGTLDLHTFRPADARAVVRDYLGACREAGVLHVRIVHGKGKGVLRRIVRALLAELPWVLEVREGTEGGGGWGATLVRLAPAALPSQEGGAAAAPEPDGDRKE